MPNHSLLLMTVASLLISHGSASTTEETAPILNILIQKSDNPYKNLEATTLSCQAMGNPAPEYFWMRNGSLLHIDGNQTLLEQGTGNLVIKKPTKNDNGDYQCLAKNKFGTAVGIKMKVKLADLQPFSTVTGPRIVEVKVGEKLTIECKPPYSYPPGSTYFGFNRQGSNILENIVNDNRVLLDYDGNLHFANVLMNDSLSYIGVNVNYLCVISNPFLGAYVQGNDHRIRPIDSPARATYHPPALMWPSYSSVVAIKGQNKLLKCIFSGLPTPNVTWRRDDSRYNDRFSVTKEGCGTEIRLPSVDLEDEDYYTCTASNGNSRTASHRMKLIVQSPPFWSKTTPEHTLTKKKKVPTATLR